MKKKTFKKIVLTKETLRYLDALAVKDVAGGISNFGSCNASCATDATCGTCKGMACATDRTVCC